ncbi:MAG: sensor histidine kinase, partial [Acidimicrobiia bacterium]
MRRRFFWGTAAVAVVTLLIGGLTAAILINRSVERSKRHEFFRQAEATGLLLEARLDAPLREGGGVRALGELLHIATAIGGHDYVEAVLVGPRGIINPIGEAEPTLIPQLPLGIADIERPRSFDVTIGDDRVLALARPIQVGPRGTLVVVIGTTLDLLPWETVLARFLLALGVAVVLAGLLAVWLSGWLGRHLEGLRGASRRIAEGDLSVRVAAEGKDEVAEVARSFNQMAERLEHSQRRERDFLISVGHDLRTPLTTISGYAEALADGDVDPDDLPRVAGVLGSQADRLSRLVEDLMLLSRLEAGQFTLRPEPVDLAAHLKEVAEGLRGRADAVPNIWL